MSSETQKSALAADPVASIEGGKMIGKVKVRFDMDLYVDGLQKVDPLTSEDFCRFSSILGSEKFLTVTSYIRREIENALRSWILAVGFADSMEKLGPGLTPDEKRRLTEDLESLFLEVVGTREAAGHAEYEKYAEATQVLGFEGVSILENVTGELNDRARELALGGSA